MKKMISLGLTLVMALAISVPSFAADKVNGNSENKKQADQIYEGVVSYVNEVYPDLAKTEKSNLIDRLYKEKSQATSKSQIQSRNNRNEVDEAYQNVMAEEEYIVDLINSRGASTALDNWQFNLKYLKQNYDAIKKIPNVNMTYVDSYIAAYESVLAAKDMPTEKVNTCTTLATNGSYNYDQAVNYAKKYYRNYNSAYPSWASAGGDCANFVSQCLYAGGKPMKGTPGSASSASNWSNWFSRGNTQNTNNVSSTWRGAQAFRSYWQTNASSYKKFTSVDSSSFNYGWTGDAVSLLNSNGRAYHTLIIVGYSSPDFTVGAHTGDTIDGSLRSYASSNGFIIYNMR